MDDQAKNTVIIKCPHCGREYLWSEIFYRDDISGKPKNIIKDALGHIIYVDYEEDSEPTLTQKYICDDCNKPFITEAIIKVETRSEEEALDFSEEYVSLL